MRDPSFPGPQPLKPYEDKLARAAFAWVIAETSMTAVDQQRCLDLFLWQCTGEVIRQAQWKALAAETGPWRWAWFEWCAGQFRETGAYPYLWRRDGLGLEGHEAGATYHRGHLQALIHTAAFVLGQERERANATWLYWVLKGDRVRPFTSHCPVETAATGAHAKAYLAGDLSHLPPFFPGDRSSLMSTVETRGVKSDAELRPLWARGQRLAQRIHETALQPKHFRLLGYGAPQPRRDEWPRR